SLSMSLCFYPPAHHRYLHSVPTRRSSDLGKKFITPDSDEFSDLLYDSTIARMEATGKYTAEQLSSFYKFQIVPDKDYIHRIQMRSEEHTSELQSRENLVCRLLLEKKKKQK